MLKRNLVPLAVLVMAVGCAQRPGEDEAAAADESQAITMRSPGDTR